MFSKSFKLFIEKYLFNLDVISIYTVIFHHNGLRTLKLFFDTHSNQEMLTTVWVQLAELVFTLINFLFHD